MPSPSSYLPSVPHVTATKIKFPKTQASVFCSPSFPQGEVCHNQVWQARVTAGEQTLNFATGETCPLPRNVTSLERAPTQSTHSEGIPAVDCYSPLSPNLFGIGKLRFKPEIPTANHQGLVRFSVGLCRKNKNPRGMPLCPCLSVARFSLRTSLPRCGKVPSSSQATSPCPPRQSAPPLPSLPAPQATERPIQTRKRLLALQQRFSMLGSLRAHITP